MDKKNTMKDANFWRKHYEALSLFLQVFLGGSKELLANAIGNGVGVCSTSYSCLEERKCQNWWKDWDKGFVTLRKMLKSLLMILMIFRTNKKTKGNNHKKGAIVYNFYVDV